MPRLSFSLRDVFWLTLVVGVGLGWLVYDRGFNKTRRDAYLYRSLKHQLRQLPPADVSDAISVDGGVLWIKAGKQSSCGYPLND